VAAFQRISIVSVAQPVPVLAHRNLSGMARRADHASEFFSIYLDQSAGAGAVLALGGPDAVPNYSRRLSAGCDGLPSVGLMPTGRDDSAYEGADGSQETGRDARRQTPGNCWA